MEPADEKSSAEIFDDGPQEEIPREVTVQPSLPGTLTRVPPPRCLKCRARQN